MNRSKPADLHVWPDWIDEVVEELKGREFNAETLRAVILRHAPLDSFVRRVDVANLEPGDALLVQLPSGLAAKLHRSIVQDLRVQVAQVCPGAQVVATTDVVEVVGLLRPPRTAEAKPTRPSGDVVLDAASVARGDSPPWSLEAMLVVSVARRLRVATYGTPAWSDAVRGFDSIDRAVPLPPRVLAIAEAVVQLIDQAAAAGRSGSGSAYTTLARELQELDQETIARGEAHRTRPRQPPPPPTPPRCATCGRVTSTHPDRDDGPVCRC